MKFLWYIIGFLIIIGTTLFLILFGILSQFNYEWSTLDWLIKFWLLVLVGTVASVYCFVKAKKIDQNINKKEKNL